MKKEWHVKVQEKVLGPFTPLELKRVPGVNVRSFVWKKGFNRWKRIKEVEELLAFFEKEKKKPKKPDFIHREENKSFVDEEMVLDMRKPPLFPFLILLLLFLAILAFFAKSY